MYKKKTNTKEYNKLYERTVDILIVVDFTSTKKNRKKIQRELIVSNTVPMFNVIKYTIKKSNREKFYGDNLRRRLHLFAKD